MRAGSAGEPARRVPLDDDEGVCVMNKKASILIAILWAVLLAAGCSGGTTPHDSGLPPEDGDDGKSDGPTLCQTNADCPDGMECKGGVCQSGQHCDCNYDCDKSKNEVCNQATHQCETGAPPVNCQTDCDCYTGESCIGGTCTPTGGDEVSCTIDDECADNEKCQNGRCVPISCTTREDCAGPVCLVCKNGECTAPPPVCQGDQDCCVGFHCNFGTCVPDATGCQSDADCTDEDFPRCVDGECVQECISDIDCPLPGQVCIDNHCETPGCTPESCPQGQWCDTGDGQCKPGCDSNDDCIPPETCNYTTHQCGQTDCCGGCDSDHYCDSLTCQCVEKCDTDADCPAGFTCKADGRCWCTSGSCPAGSHCDPSTGECVQDTVECQTDADCPAGWTCNPATNTCESSGGSGEGDFCFTDDQCDQAAGLLCDSSLFCIGCMFADPDFEPTFTCRYECSLLGGSCPIPDRECKYRHLGLKGLCVPP